VRNGEKTMKGEVEAKRFGIFGLHGAIYILYYYYKGGERKSGTGGEELTSMA